MAAPVLRIDHLVNAAASVRRKSNAAVVVLAGAFVSLAAFGCRDHPQTMLGPDTVAPILSVTFPTVSDPRFPESFDRDSNGLLDLELRWTDSLSRVDTGSLRITVLGGMPGALADTNLARGWRRVRLDASGAVFEETIPLLLRGGVSALVLSVADTAGNRAVDTLHLALPQGSFHRTISLDYRPEWTQQRAANLVLLPDGSKGAVPFEGGRVAIFDPNGAWPTRYVQGVPNLLFAGGISLDSATGLSYLGGGGGQTAGISVVDLRAEQFVRSVRVGLGVASVFVYGDRVYVGEACTTGRIIVLEKSSLAEVGRVEPDYPYQPLPCHNSVVRSVSPDESTAWAVTVDAGAMAFDTDTYQLKEHIAVPYGNARDIRGVSNQWLYLAKLGGGLDELDIGSGTTTAHYPAQGPPWPTIVELAPLAPRGLLFVSAHRDGLDGYDVRAPLLFDIPGLRLRWAFPHRPGAISDAAVWHPDGKRVYVMAEFNVDVYLVRPD